MGKPFISLRPEITRSHAHTLMDWMSNERVTHHLSDSRGVSRQIEQAVERAQMPILTHLFNQGGRFFMAYDENDRPVGFVRLVKTGADCEIVLAVGDHENWGRGLGGSMIREGLKYAFLDMRAENVIAKIHADNTRSLKGFESCGFRVRHKTPTHTASMTARCYRQNLRDGVLANSAEIFVTGIDKVRLETLIAVEDEGPMPHLEHEIERAIVVEPENVPHGVVTMNSRVVLCLDGSISEIALAYPREAAERAGHLSISSAVGTAILGYKEGSVIDSVIANRTRKILIERVVYQPESSGHLHL